MGLFGAKEGSWSTRCASDPRFNMRGRGAGYVIDGGPDEISRAILAKQKELGMTDAELDALTIETFFCKD